jgi:hypothetical protein
MPRFGISQRLLAIAVAAILAAPVSAAAQEISFGKRGQGSARYLGVVSLSPGAAGTQVSTPTSGGAFALDPRMFTRPIPQSQSLAAMQVGHIASVKPPKLKHPIMLVDDSSMNLGFDGLDSYDSWNLNAITNASTPGNLSAEPPDQALCVGGGYAVEAINDALVVYNTSDNSVAAGPISLYTAMGVSLDAQPAGCDLHSTGPNACALDAVADPRCIYDSGKFFVTATHIAYDGSASDLRLLVLQAGSTSGTAYVIPTTNNGTDYSTEPNDPGCPCYQDQPLLGADGNNIYISGNEFTLSSTSAFDGAYIYAVPKSELTSGPPVSNLSSFAWLSVNAASVSPSISPNGAYDTDNGGTEFFLFSLAGATTPQKKIGVVVLVGTCAIPSIVPTSGCPLDVGGKVARTKAYALSPSASEASGPNPYGQSLSVSTVPQLDTGDQRMQQVVYTGGKLYGALTTGITVGGQLQSGILWMSATPRVRVKIKRNTGAIKVKVGAKLKSGYIAASGYDLFYPSIAATPSGSVTIAFDISSPSIWPSIGYANVIGGADQNAHLTAAGIGPDDGFTAYPPYSNGVGRWGDYTAATIDESGNFWFGAEYIAQTCDSTEYAGDDTCGGTRSPYTNWATRITKITP